MEQWKVQSSTGQCAGTGRKLEEGESYYAALIDRGVDGFERVDYSVAYWEEKKPEVFSFWKTVVPEKNQKKSVFVDNDVLIHLFERLGDQADESKINFRFVLALILMRKRLLKYEGSYWKGDQELWKLRFVREKEIHEVVNPHIEEEMIEKLSNELRGVLRGELCDEQENQEEAV